MANTTMRAFKSEENAMGRARESASIRIADLPVQMVNILILSYFDEKAREMVYLFFEIISCEENQIAILLTQKALM
jgi:hypothetical protein